MKHSLICLKDVAIGSISIEFNIVIGFLLTDEWYHILYVLDKSCVVHEYRVHRHSWYELLQ